MQELLGRLSALDPEASEALRVVSYFDALTANGVGRESLLRGAATLAGTIVGHRVGDRVLRVAADGGRLPAETDAYPVSAQRTIGQNETAWIERLGAPLRNDSMILERLTLALATLTARRDPARDATVETAISALALPAERLSALRRLRLDAAPELVATATAPEQVPFAGAPSSVIATPRGLARVTLHRANAVDVPPGRVGIGAAVVPEHLPESWAGALVALRLSTPKEPTVLAAEIGGLLVLAGAADAANDRHPDVITLAGLDAGARNFLDALLRTGSVRAASIGTGVHHSTGQARLERLRGLLGYDPRSPNGVARYAVARTLLLLDRPGLGLEITAPG